MSVVGLGSGTGSSVNNPHFTTTAAIPAGALAFVAVFTGNGAINSVSDGTNSYTAAVSLTDGSTQVTALWYKENAAAVSSGATITATLASSPAVSLLLAFYVDDGATSGSFDVSASNAGASNTPVTTGTTAATAQAAEIAVAAFSTLWVTTGNNLGTGSAGYTAFTEVSANNGGTQNSLLVAYQLLSATGTQSASTTPNTAPARGNGVIATFKRTAAVAGGGRVPKLASVPTVPTLNAA